MAALLRNALLIALMRAMNRVFCSARVLITPDVASNCWCRVAGAASSALICLGQFQFYLNFIGPFVHAQDASPTFRLADKPEYCQTIPYRFYVYLHSFIEPLNPVAQAQLAEFPKEM